MGRSAVSSSRLSIASSSAANPRSDAADAADAATTVAARAAPVREGSRAPGLRPGCLLHGWVGVVRPLVLRSGGFSVSVVPLVVSVLSPFVERLLQERLFRRSALPEQGNDHDEHEQDDETASQYEGADGKPARGGRRILPAASSSPLRIRRKARARPPPAGLAAPAGPAASWTSRSSIASSRSESRSRSSAAVSRALRSSSVTSSPPSGVPPAEGEAGRGGACGAGPGAADPARPPVPPRLFVAGELGRPLRRG